MKRVAFSYYQELVAEFTDLEKQKLKLKEERFTDWVEFDKLSDRQSEIEPLISQYRCWERKRALKLAIAKLDVAIKGLNRSAKKSGERQVVSKIEKPSERQLTLIREYGDFSYNDLQDAYGYDCISEEDYEYLVDRLNQIQEDNEAKETYSKNCPEAKAVEILEEFQGELKKEMINIR